MKRQTSALHSHDIAFNSFRSSHSIQGIPDTFDKGLGVFPWPEMAAFFVSFGMYDTELAGQRSLCKQTDAVFHSSQRRVYFSQQQRKSCRSLNGWDPVVSRFPWIAVGIGIHAHGAADSISSLISSFMINVFICLIVYKVHYRLIPPSMMMSAPVMKLEASELR